MIIVESFRDGIQGLTSFIPTGVKLDFLSVILGAGFDIIDVGSFVSPRAVPQMKDTGVVIDQLDLTNTKTKLLVLTVNHTGAEKACQYKNISYISYPHSASPSFLKKNINKNNEQSLQTIKEIKQITQQYNKELIVYLAMAFGNPYDDEWNLDIIRRQVTELDNIGITKIPLSDIMGDAKSEDIALVFSSMNEEFPHIKFGLHLHCKKEEYLGKLNAAYSTGCRWFECVINGLGGCPMTGAELVGNLNTFSLIEFMKEKGIPVKLNEDVLKKAIFEIN